MKFVRVSDLDIWCAANLLIRKHGADAELEAAKRADLMLDRGDDDGRLLWARIRRAIEALQTPRRGRLNWACDRAKGVAAATGCVHLIQMSPSVPLTNVTGSGGGRARSPGVAQRPTGARNADGLNHSWCFTERARPARLVERLSRL
jgi:hypothetical protein